MSDNLVTALVSIVVAIIGLAAFATAVSPKASTAGVIQAGASGLGNDIAVAVSPVSGTSVTPTLSYPTSLGNGL
jgi:PRD1 phage membrane DNA delivery